MNLKFEERKMRIYEHRPHGPIRGRTRIVTIFTNNITKYASKILSDFIVSSPSLTRQKRGIRLDY